MGSDRQLTLPPQLGARQAPSLVPEVHSEKPDVVGAETSKGKLGWGLWRWLSCKVLAELA